MRYARGLVLGAAITFLPWSSLGLPEAQRAALAMDDVEPFPDEWFFYGAERPEELRALEGKKAIELSIEEWRGDETTLAESMGKVVVVDFWATWCGPCMAAIPKNVAMVDKYKDKGLVFLGVHDARSGWDRVDQVISEKNINYPVAKDQSSQSAEAYKLKFWPTYVVVDKEGIIRGAGLSPGHVEDAVKILLDEPYEGQSPDASASASFPDDWFLGGEKRPASQRKAEGQRVTSLEGEAWIGEPLTRESWNRKVVIVQFADPGFGGALERLERLTPLAKKYGRQGVVFLGVSDAHGDWERMQRAVKAREVTIPIALDKPMPEGKEGNGVIADRFGVCFGWPVGVVDRAGVIRAVGLKPEHVETVINKLLAEPMPPQDAAEDATPGEE